MLRMQQGIITPVKHHSVKRVGKVMSRSIVKLSRREREIMDILYRLGRAGASEVREHLADPPSYSAVRAMLAKLEGKGHIEHEQDGARYVFAPVVAKAEARETAVSKLVRTFFGGSASAAVTGLLGRSVDEMSDEELDHLSEMIDKAKRGRSQS